MSKQVVAEVIALIELGMIAPEDIVKCLRKANSEPEQALAAPVQEPVAWKWHQAPVKTSWGHDMVVADLAIDKDNTVSVYCERDYTAKVEAMFSTPPAAQRQWVGLTDEERRKIWGELPQTSNQERDACIFAQAVELFIKEKNT